MNKLRKILDWTTIILLGIIIGLDMFHVLGNADQVLTIVITCITGSIIMIGALLMCWFCYRYGNDVDEDAIA